MGIVWRKKNVVVDKWFIKRCYSLHEGINIEDDWKTKGNECLGEMMPQEASISGDLVEKEKEKIEKYNRIKSLQLWFAITTISCCLCVAVLLLHAGGRMIPGGIVSPPGSGGSTGNIGNTNSAAIRRGNRRLTRNESRYHSGEYNDHWLSRRKKIFSLSPFHHIIYIYI